MSTKTCIVCNETLPLSAFEEHAPGKYRRPCKECRKDKRKDRVKNAEKDPDAAVLPERCIRCGHPPGPNVSFTLRYDQVTINYITTCDNCSNVDHNRRHRNYVQRQRENDEEAYLARNAAYAREYRKTHADEISAWATKNVNRRLTAIQGQAKKKGILWDVNSMTDDVCSDMMQSPCLYCGYLDLDVTVNGIDRLDSGGNYTFDNCKPACGPCNWAKRCLDPHTFIERAKHIHGIASYPEAWADRVSGSFADYKNRAEKDGIPFDLSPAQVDSFRNGDCAYCTRPTTATNVNGIDRIDSNGGYTFDNVCTACGECNYMKGSMSQDEFLALCKKVAMYERGDVPDVPRQLYSL